MAYGDLACSELQERNQQLLNPPRPESHSEVRMVHASPHPSRTEEWQLGQAGRDWRVVEIDETFIGPNPRKMHAARRLKAKTATNGYAGSHRCGDVGSGYGRYAPN